MSAAIIEAINGRKHLSFTYDGHPRTVQPAAIGPHVSTGNLSLRGYQVDGTSNSRAVPFWNLFTVAKISDLVVLDAEFGEDPPGYQVGDKHLNVIAEL